MNAIFTTLAPGLFEAGARLIDRLIPDPAEREKAKLALLQAKGQQAGVGAQDHFQEWGLLYGSPQK